tara:strand:+ start:2438 stop:2635 length:198 start_codon:yes stop_codon:yes gene_type:complete
MPTNYIITPHKKKGKPSKRLPQQLITGAINLAWSQKLICCSEVKGNFLLGKPHVYVINNNETWRI